MRYIEIISIFFISYTIYLFLNKFKIFYKIKKDNHQNFTHKDFILPIGGYYLLVSLIIFNLLTISLEIYYLILIFFIGALSDLKKFNSPKLRLIIQSILILLFIYQSQIQILSTRIDFLDNLLTNYYFNIFFVSFCLLIVINGTNFIDGLNGLVLTYYLCIIFILFSSGLNIKIFENEFFFIQLIGILSILLVLNIFNKLYLGDSGSYLLGFLFSVILIKFYLINQSISPFFIILLLWYPCFENLFSILRKYKYRKSPIKPDTKHLHQLLFYFLDSKLKFKNKLVNNNLSSFLINFFNLIIFIIGLSQSAKTNIQIFLILINVITYLFIYSRLFKYRYRNLKK